MTPRRVERTAPASPAFEEFVLDHGVELVGFARRLTLDHHRAEDLVQDVLARLGLRWAKVTQADDVRAYVQKAVLNEFLSWRRRRSSRERPTGFARDRAAATARIDEGVAHRDQLARWLAVLSPVQRAVVVLRYHHDRPDGEIAAMLGCPESTVRSHARRALALLRSHPDQLAERTGR